MANNCNVLMKEAFDNYLGIDMRYKLDDTLAALGKQKLNATQLEGYLLKQGVSPKEIKQAGILENFRGDNRAFSGEDWLSISGNQKVDTFRVAPEDAQFDSITLDSQGVHDSSKYKEILSTVKAPSTNKPDVPHFSEELPPSESLLGWRRTHVQEIEGKPTLVLNEFQSDWAQTERAGRGTFESSAPKPSSSSMTKEEAKEIFAKYSNSFFSAKQSADPDKSLSLEEIRYKYWDDWIYYRTESGPTELIEADKIRNAGFTKVVANFPMSEIKHHQFQIVGAIDDALKQGIDTIAIPIQRENELAGSAGVTKFYENLNKKVLPEIRSKLEKQGLKIKVDKTPYANTNELWKLTVEEIPNKPVKWDVYGLIGALGLSSMLAGDANAEELKPSQVSISPKTNQQTQQQPQPIMGQMTTQPEVIEQPRQQMDEGFSLRKLLESDKLAPEVDEQSTASLFEQLGLVKKDDLGNYRVNKDIDEDSRVDMRKQMPKTIQDQEGEYLTTHRPTKKSGWTIGRGYDSTGRKLQDIINDFTKAGISQQKAIAFFKHKPISINSTQSKALGDIAWQEKVKVAKSIGLPMEELDKEGFLKVMSLVYRGDIVKGDDGYRGRLYNYAKNGNIKAIDRFINTEARNMEGGSVLYNRWKKFNKES